MKRMKAGNKRRDKYKTTDRKQMSGVTAAIKTPSKPSVTWKMAMRRKQNRKRR